MSVAALNFFVQPLSTSNVFDCVCYLKRFGFFLEFVVCVFVRSTRIDLCETSTVATWTVDRVVDKWFAQFADFSSRRV